MLQWMQSLPPVTLVALGALVISAGAYGSNYGRYHALSLGGLILCSLLTIGGGLTLMYGCHYYYNESDDKLGYAGLAILSLVVFFSANEMGKRHGRRDEEKAKRNRTD